MTELVVINPNSSQKVTDGIAAALVPLERAGVAVRCLTLSQGPPAIESQLQADLTIAPLVALAQDQPDAGGFVIACFGDPGLHALRDAVPVPVIGIQEAAAATALTLGHRFGVISILAASIPRHLRSFGAMGLLDRLAGDRAIGLGVAELANADTCLQAMLETGAKLRDEDGADVLIMGCAGMAQYRETLQGRLGLPVVDPCQAGVAMALGHMTLGYTQKFSGPQDA